MATAGVQAAALSGEVILELRRRGRRPRYHRGARQGGTGVVLDPPQCNLDQGGLGRRVLPELPDLRRPWAQLCRRCWAGTTTLQLANDILAAREARRHGQEVSA